MSLPLIALLFVFPAAMAYAAASDLVSMTISNRLCLVLMVTFAVCAAMLGLGWVELGWHLAAGGLVLVVCFGMFAAGWIGGGDAKLAAVTALWFGFDQLMPYLMVAALGGGVLTFAMLKLRSGPLPEVASGWSWARRLHSPKEGVPYGIALAFAALLVLPSTSIWRAAIGV
ncbi:MULTISPECIES: prepilin peptidase [Bosea]|jgi:prepilin peptidase CpaA|uniref:Peptidase n=1 Tax=Bosea vaviloviae TaxID=1526658 RepID=A0A0N0MAK7_9HYPH|nr:prepilin peptidase [Bosea vaviloviae]KPH79754.1 peptidase [Bosea vaviloviae]